MRRILDNLLNVRKPFLFCSFRLGLLALVVMGAVSCANQSKHNIMPSLEAPATGEVYRLRAGDIVQMDVFQEPIMTTRQRIQGDGTISIGLIGRVDLQGDTVESGARKIEKLLDGKYLVKPQVTLTVLAYSPRRFTVWGQVKSPGSYVIPPEQTISLPEAIAMAGGNSDIGNLKRVVISRDNHGTIDRIRMNALSPDAQNFAVKEGDVIFVTETIF